MREIIADGEHYFDRDGFPLAVWRVCTDADHSASHPHDLTEVAHRHDFCELVIVTGGDSMHWLEGRVFPVAAGDVFLLQGNQHHYFYDRRNLELINIMYDSDRIDLPEGELRKMPGYCAIFMLEPSYRHRHRFASHLHLGRDRLAHVEELAEDMEREFRARRPGFGPALRAKHIELIVYLSREYNASETIESKSLLRIGDVIGTLEKDYSQDLTLADLQDIAHMSRSNLMRVFRKATGQTPIDYLIRLRIQRAMEMLRQSDSSVTEIAFEVGFKDSNYFSRQFRRIEGCSPSEYRARH
jgi:AraC-like DNA-binding protein/mannose-6-phosphate isomerase-like protein (cupin superfamily)